MTDERMVPMNAEQARILEDVGLELMRRGDGREMKLLALALAYKFAKPQAPALPSNVIELRGASTGEHPSPHETMLAPAAHPPERPRASILPLDPYSRRT